ncbi:protein of unknown function [Candidatus Filomicrobium marinum]|nr:protein of unknown function [Candidatus Filomicrobium marinum]
MAPGVWLRASFGHTEHTERHMARTVRIGFGVIQTAPHRSSMAEGKTRLDLISKIGSEGAGNGTLG